MKWNKWNSLTCLKRSSYAELADAERMNSVCAYSGKWMRKASALYLTILQVLLNSAPPCFPCRGHVVKESRGAWLSFCKQTFLFIYSTRYETYFPSAVKQSKGLLIDFLKNIFWILTWFYCTQKQNYFTKNKFTRVKIISSPGANIQFCLI